ncbi:MAG: tRNA 2-thiocytidine biosynthesis protein TtcA [Clostridia bacterium]|nr:tRNA 2-thiocytidine biosynthesis protein TtcA [Clostridia bacterium]
MQKLMSHMRAAMEDYNMIEEGDKVAVGVSGGKDSLALLYALAQMRRFYPKKYSLVAITLDLGFGGECDDYSAIEAICRELDVPYVVKKTQIGEIIFDVRKESNPCSLCARMRRGALHDAAIEQGCNRLALGHHLDDAAETFMMNLLHEGRIGCFSPVSFLSRKQLYMIRPMVYAFEKDVRHACRNLELPVIKSRCPNDGESARQDAKNLIHSLEKEYPRLRQKILTALQNGNIDGFGKGNSAALEKQQDLC